MRPAKCFILSWAFFGFELFEKRVAFTLGEKGANWVGKRKNGKFFKKTNVVAPGKPLKE